MRGRTTSATDRRHYHSRRAREEQSKRARSEPTPSIPSSSSVSNMDQAMAADMQSSDADDFPLADEDIPDFVMEYLQSDQGHLDEDIPDHILDYIQSRAAALERSRREASESDIVYTDEEIRILEETRRRLEEIGELKIELPPMPPMPPQIVVDESQNFDHLFQQSAPAEQVVVVASAEPEAAAEPKQVKETKQSKSARKQKKGEGKDADKKKSEKHRIIREIREVKFPDLKLRSISMPSRSQLNLFLPPKIGQEKKIKKDKKEKEVAAAEELPTWEPETKKAKQRTQSVSPMRQKINAQWESWSSSLKTFKVSGRGRTKEGPIKSFVALLPGTKSKKKEEVVENQYEEIGAPRLPPPPVPDQVAVADQHAVEAAVVETRQLVTDVKIIEPDPDETKSVDDNLPPVDYSREDPLFQPDRHSQQENEAEETMEEIDNLPESEVAEPVVTAIVVVDKEVVDKITVPEFVDVPIDDEVDESFEGREMAQPRMEQGAPPPTIEITQDEGAAPVQEAQQEEPKAEGLAARSRKAFEATKSKIHHATKEGMEATRKKLQSTATLSKEKMNATRKKLQSTATLSKEKMNATSKKLQNTLSGTLKKKKKKGEEASLPAEAEAEAEAKAEAEAETEANIFQPVAQSEFRDYETSTPTEMKVSRKNKARRKSEEDVCATAPPTAKRRTKKPVRATMTQSQPDLMVSSHECGNIQEEDEEEDEEEELEPKLEFSIHGSVKMPPSSTSQSTETLPQGFTFNSCLSTQGRSRNG